MRAGLLKVVSSVSGRKRVGRLFGAEVPVDFESWSRLFASHSHSSPTRDSSRLELLKKKLAEDGKIPLTKAHVFEISERGKDFLKEVGSGYLNKKYSRGGESGDGHVGVGKVLGKVPKDYYEGESKDHLLRVAEEVQDRMRVKVSESYLNHALKVPSGAVDPSPILKIVMPDSEELADTSGEVDPSNQNRYSPMPGLLHKYEMLLAFVSINCSSHCRYCYRLDLFSGASKKSKADMELIAAYVKTFNNLIDDAIKESGTRDKKTGLWIHKETGEPLIHIKEILFSGGDPMTLPNATLARYMALMAEAGVSSIRIGTKEMSFNPERFDARFWEVMDRFHETYPEVKVDIVGHYSHPFELVEAKIDEEGKYLYDIEAKYRVRQDLKAPLDEIRKRSDWVGHHNQFPIIAGVNDSPDIIRLIMHQSHRLGIDMHNIYACREIEGNKHFRGDNTIEAQYDLVERAKIGLSGLTNHGRLVMSTEYGKIEVFGVNEEGHLVRGLNRFIHGQKPSKTFIEVDPAKIPEGKKFYWLTDEVIEAAVSGEGKKVLEEMKAENSSFIAHLKRAAAKRVMSHVKDEKSVEAEVESASRKVAITVVTKNGGLREIEVDLDNEKYAKKPPTLATVLSESEAVEASCKEQLSCSTCVGEVESDVKLAEPSLDEMDLVDSVFGGKTPSAKGVEIRAGCQVPLKPGKYKFTSLGEI